MAHHPPETPALRLRRLRKELRLTQQAMAELLGVNRVTLSGWEGGRVLPSLKKAVLLQKRTGIPPSAWFTQGKVTP